MGKFGVFYALLTLAAVTAGQAYNESIATLLSQGQGRFLQQNNAYLLFNRNAARTAVRLVATAAGASGSNAHFRTHTMVLIHDTNSIGQSDFSIVIRDALLSTEDVSIVVVDWTWGAFLPPEFSAMVVPEVAAGLTEFLRLYFVGNRINPGRLHIVGFGLGAHIAGITARSLKRLNANYEVARITGLDPTGGPTWSSAAVRLTATDARYVEVIHTDMSNVGTEDALGHLDFYINGGINQPGCEIDTDCSHKRAWEVFAASLTHSLQGNKCSGDIPLEPNCRGFVVSLGNNQLTKYGNGLFFVEAPSDKYPYTGAGCLRLCEEQAPPEETEPSPTDPPAPPTTDPPGGGF